MAASTIPNFFLPPMHKMAFGLFLVYFFLKALKIRQLSPFWFKFGLFLLAKKFGASLFFRIILRAVRLKRPERPADVSPGHRPG